MQKIITLKNWSVFMDKIDSIVESISKKLTDYDFVKNIIK